MRRYSMLADKWDPILCFFSNRFSSNSHLSEFPFICEQNSNQFWAKNRQISESSKPTSFFPTFENSRYLCEKSISFVIKRSCVFYQPFGANYALISDFPGVFEYLAKVQHEVAFLLIFLRFPGSDRFGSFHRYGSSTTD